MLEILFAILAAIVPPCAHDEWFPLGSAERVACHWDASERSNGQGFSYVSGLNFELVEHAGQYSAIVRADVAIPATVGSYR